MVVDITIVTFIKIYFGYPRQISIWYQSQNILFILLSLHQLDELEIKLGYNWYWSNTWGYIISRDAVNETVERLLLLQLATLEVDCIWGAMLGRIWLFMGPSDILSLLTLGPLLWVVYLLLVSWKLIMMLISTWKWIIMHIAIIKSRL